ncbi:MAG: electron transfer flavoprotein subunit alpha/FixB family protein [Dissulfuribacterales bacterium]
MSSALIVAEHLKGKVKSATFNTLTFAHQVSNTLGAKLCILVIGKNVQDVAASLQPYGADTIYVVEDAGLGNCTSETWGHVIAEVAKECGAVFVGMNSGTTGRNLMPRVAGKLNAGMVTDVVGMEGTDYIREMWAGNALATVSVTTPLTVTTIQGTAFAKAEPNETKSAITTLEISVPETKTRFIEMRETVSDRPDPTEARVVVSGGRGMKGSENFKLIEELTDLFGGAVGASRAAVDAGWISNDFQIGQTGKMVAPDLYIAAGISGAIQHLAGMKNSKVIVAINKDDEAPIFQVADFGLVADLFKVVPELTEALKSELV